MSLPHPAPAATQAPAPAAVPSVRIARAARSRWPLYGMLLLFLAPLVLGGALHWSGWRPAQPANHGELLDPPRPLPALAEPDGRPLDAERLRGRWQLVIAAGGRCDAACARWLESTKNIHLALHKQSGRLARLVVTGAPGAMPKDGGDAGLLHARAPDAAARAALELDAPGGPRLFVVDPQGRVMLRYGPDADPRGLLKDLERLLRYTWTPA